LNNKKEKRKRSIAKNKYKNKKRKGKSSNQKPTNASVTPVTAWNKKLPTRKKSRKIKRTPSRRRKREKGTITRPTSQKYRCHIR